MLSRIVVTALTATILSAALAQAQSVSRLGGPANYPPAGFSGQQFVDNKGCVFLKAGFGATINWVPRVGADRRALCGQPPSFGTAVAAAVAADMQADPMAVAAPVVRSQPVVTQPAPAAPSRPMFAGLVAQPTVGNPIPLVPVVTPTPAAPIVMAQPAVAPPVIAQPGYITTSTGIQAQCVPASPRLETVVLRSGGTALVCTRGDGTLNGWRSPLFAQGTIGAALTPRVMQGATLATAYAAPRNANANAIPTPPPGYRLAWTDDRLNPARGIGTAAGQAQQDQIWTRTVPAHDVNVEPTRRGIAGILAAATAPATATRPAAARTTVSTMSAPAIAAQAYVQIGTFGQPANAAGVKARLTALGLPVSTSQITRKGKVLQIVFAGPFASRTEAQSALATTRGAGFTDAILK